MILALPFVALVVSAAPPDACAWRGPLSAQLTLRVPGRASPVTLVVQDASATATMGAKHGLDVSLTGAIALDASAPQLWLHVQREVTSDDGLVSLAPGARFIAERRDAPGRVSGRVVLAADDVLDSEHHVQPDESLAAVALPCDALGIGAPAPGPAGDGDPPEGAGDATGDENAAWFESRGARLSLRSRPHDDAPGRALVAAHCDAGCLHLEEAQPPAGSVVPRGWRFVAARGMQATARGFVRATALRRLPDDTASGRGAFCGGHDVPMAGRSRAWAGGPPADLYEGVARLREGAALYLDDDVRPFASTRAAFEVRVEWVRGTARARVVALPDIGIPEALDVTVDAARDLTLP